MRVNRVLDLSVPVDSSTVVYPGDPVPRFEVHSTIEREGFNLLEIHLGSQSGTHVDAPYHFEPDGLRVDEIPPDRFVGPGVVVDGSGLGARGVIDWEHVEPVAHRLGPPLRHLDLLRAPLPRCRRVSADAGSRGAHVLHRGDQH